VVLASGASYTSGKGRRTTEASAEALTTLLAALEKVPQEQQHKWLKDHLGIKVSTNCNIGLASPEHFQQCIQ
jgi:hypothetical protein